MNEQLGVSARRVFMCVGDSSAEHGSPELTLALSGLGCPMNKLDACGIREIGFAVALSLMPLPTLKPRQASDVPVA